MRNSIQKQIKNVTTATDHKVIKVQLDYKTFITLSRLSSLAVWRHRYPDAHVIAH
jgi:hypothetical protein